MILLASTSEWITAIATAITVPLSIWALVLAHLSSKDKQPIDQGTYANIARKAVADELEKANRLGAEALAEAKAANKIANQALSLEAERNARRVTTEIELAHESSQGTVLALTVRNTSSTVPAALHRVRLLCGKMEHGLNILLVSKDQDRIPPMEAGIFQMCILDPSDLSFEFDQDAPPSLAVYFQDSSTPIMLSDKAVQDYVEFLKERQAKRIARNRS